MIEFETVINGEYIKLPENESLKGKNVKVIILDLPKSNNELLDEFERISSNISHVKNVDIIGLEKSINDDIF
jgi:hypothetical protein